MKLKFEKGFTLIELLVVISIIGLLSSMVLASLNTARAKSRDSARISGIIQVRNALELYYTTNSSYPIGPESYIDGSGNQINNTSSCQTGNGGPGNVVAVNAVIPSLVSGKFIPSLPVDPKNSTPCYLYASNGKDYKFMEYYVLENPISVNSQFYIPILEAGQTTLNIYTSGAKTWDLADSIRN